MTSSQLTSIESNTDSSGVVMVTLLGMPSSNITVFPIDNPILQISREKIKRKPNNAVRRSKTAGDSDSKPKPANIAFKD